MNNALQCLFRFIITKAVKMTTAGHFRLSSAILVLTVFADPRYQVYAGVLNPLPSELILMRYHLTANIALQIGKKWEHCRHFNLLTNKNLKTF